MVLPLDLVLGGLFIFGCRICDVSIGTVRLILLTRGQKYYAAVLGFFEVFIFIVAISQVIRNANNWWNVLGYCAGFAAGNIVGVTIEERIAFGFSLVRIFSPDKGAHIAAALRDNDYGATETFGQGKDGPISIVETAVRRRDVARVQQIVAQIDDKAFVVIDEARSIFQGYLRRKGKVTIPS